MDTYSMECTITDRDVDMFRRLRCSALFSLLQDAAGRHCELLDASRDTLLKKNLIWVVALQRAEIKHMPEYGDKVILETWTGKPRLGLYPRYCRVLNGGGETLAATSALWALMERDTRKMVSTAQAGVSMPEMLNGNEIPLPRKPRPIQASREESFTVPYSFLDMNGHLNNTRYFDLAEDAAGLAAEGKQLREVCVEYSNEARLGEKLRLQVGQEENMIYVAGDSDKRIFCMGMEYEKARE